MENYEIRYDDKFGQLTHIDLAAEGAAHDPWYNRPPSGSDNPARHRAPSACPGAHCRADGRASDSGADRERLTKDESPVVRPHLHPPPPLGRDPDRPLHAPNSC
jgi:hypothetical protein